MAVAITLDVGLRYFKAGSVGWVVEVSEYDLFVITMLGAPWVLRHSGHVRVDLVIVALPRRARRIGELLAEFVGLAVSLCLLVFGFMGALEAFQSGAKIFKTLTLDEWWLLALVPFCGLLLAVECLRRIYRLLRGDDLASDQPQLGGM